MSKNASHRRKSAVQLEREKEYRIVRSRVQHRLSAYRVKGYDVSDINVPAIPKRITEGSINRLSKITPAYIRKNSKVVVAVDINTGEATKTVSGEKFYKEQQKEARRKAVETRKRRKATASNTRENEQPATESSSTRNTSDSSNSYDYSNAPHIGELMLQKIEGFIEQYNAQDSSLGKTIQGWLDGAKDKGVIDRLAQLTTDQLNDLELDIRYSSQGKRPSYRGVNALHWALTNKPMTAEEWRDIQEDYDSDAGADKFDEESFYSSDPYGFDDDDEY